MKVRFDTRKFLMVVGLVVLAGLGIAKPVAAKCVEECPNKKDGVLRNCHPKDSDGTSQDSICNQAGREEMCGGRDYICQKKGGTWELASKFNNNLWLNPTPIPALVHVWVQSVAMPTVSPLQTSSNMAGYQEFLDFQQFLRMKYQWGYGVKDQFY